MNKTSSHIDCMNLISRIFNNFKDFFRPSKNISRLATSYSYRHIKVRSLGAYRNVKSSSTWLLFCNLFLILRTSSRSFALSTPMVRKSSSVKEKNISKLTKCFSNRGINFGRSTPLRIEIKPGSRVVLESIFD